MIETQPNVDAGQIRRNGMKLAMSVGKKRHYAVYSITPRHFIETGKESGLADETVSSIKTDSINLRGV